MGWHNLSDDQVYQVKVYSSSFSSSLVSLDPPPKMQKRRLVSNMWKRFRWIIVFLIGKTINKVLKPHARCMGTIRLGLPDAGRIHLLTSTSWWVSSWSLVYCTPLAD